MKLEQIHPKKEDLYDLLVDPAVFIIRLTQRKEYLKGDSKEVAPRNRVYDGLGVSRISKNKVDELIDAFTNPEKAIVRITI